MFDIGYSEVFLTAFVALLVLGPERLPKAARFAGLWLRRARAQWASVRAELERELETERLRADLDAASAEVGAPMRELHESLREAGKAAAPGEAVAEAVAETAAAARPPESP